MSTKRTLIQTLSSKKHIENAWFALNKHNKMSRGISDETIESFAKNLNTNLKEIIKSLRAGTYSFSLLRGVPIPKKEKNSFRALKIPEVKDRVVLKAITMLIQPKLERKYKLRNKASFAYQRNLGVKNAIDRIIELYKERRPYALEGDIIKFFDTIDLDYLLKEYVFPVLKDDSLNQLIVNGLKSEIGNADELTDEQLIAFSTIGGIPQGSSLSPLLSNVYLSKFDKVLIEHGFGLVRYADDFIVMCKTKYEASAAYALCKTILEDELKLKIHELDNNNPKSKCKIVKVTQNHITFLSINFNGTRLWPEKTKITELTDRIKFVNSTKNKNLIEYLTSMKNLLEGWLSAFHFTDLKPYINKIDDRINTQIYNDLLKSDWKLNKQSKNLNNRPCITYKQRLTSGIPYCQTFLDKFVL